MPTVLQNLSRHEETKIAPRKLFDRIDTDKNRMLSPAELSAYAQANPNGRPLDEQKNVWRIADADRDGQLSFLEFVDAQKIEAEA